MGVIPSNESKLDIRLDQLRLKELSPVEMGKLKQFFEKNGPNSQMDKKKFMSTYNVAQRETNIVYEYFDMDGNGQIDKYKFTCALAMIVHASLDLRSQFLFRMYDFASAKYLTRDDIVHLVRTMTLVDNQSIKNADIQAKADEILHKADLDKDNKLSLKEFQSYALKNRELYAILDAYSILLTSNPIGTNTTPLLKDKLIASEKNNDDDADSEEDHQQENNEEEEEEKKGEFNEEDDGFDNADECDPDLYEELQKDKTASTKTEKEVEIKKGIDFGNGFAEEAQMEADQFSAVKLWKTNVINTVPSTYQPSNIDGKLPDASLELEFIHGYRTHDTRNNLRYTANGGFVYHTAAVGIVYDKEEHKQRFFNEHFDDITALAIHPNKKIVATGEIGPYPLISIWDTEENKAIVRIKEPLTKGINHLAFSQDGKYLAATAADDTHMIAVFDWEKGTAENISNITNARLKTKKGEAQFKGPEVGTCEGGRADILNICFNKNNNVVACACVKEINLFTINPGALKKKKVTGLKGADLTSILCCAYIGNALVLGSMKGNLLICPGQQVTKSIKGHTQAMNTIWPRENNSGFFTGGSDGFILTWDTKYNITQRYSIINDQIKSLSPRVRSLCEDSNGNLLVGTRGGEIIEIADGTPTVYLRGHWDKELWGLCVHPKNEVFYSVGEDKLLGVWDVQTMKIKEWCVLEEPATSVDISPNGKDLAIGCETGNFYIYDAATLKKKLMKKEKVCRATEEFKYSPCGKYLAVGGIDKDTDGFMHIFIYDVEANYKQFKKLKGHQSRVTHIDWSSDSEYIQSNSQAYELLYHTVSSGLQVKKISSLRDTEWQTWTCVLGWPVQGIWPDCASGDDINACDVDKTKRVIATSDDYGKVKLFRYPSPIDRAAYHQYNGHSSHVTSVRFLSNNKHIISIGGNDKSIFQFKFYFDEEAAQEFEELQNLDADEANPDDDEQLTYFKEEEIDGTEFSAVKPFIGEVQASSPKTKIDKNAGKAPVENIKQLKYVFGYRAFDTRMNIKYTSEADKIVYHTAALGIVIDRKTNKQQYFTNHEEDIVSLAIHPNGTTVATGQMAAKGKAKLIDLYVWNINTLPETTDVLADNRATIPKGVSNLKGSLLRAIRILQFSPDGCKLLGNGQDDNNSVAVWDTTNLNSINLIGTCKVDNARVLDAIWTSNTDFVTVGPKHIKFFKVSGRNITAAKGVFGKIKVEPLVSVATAFKKIYTGTDKGNLIQWDGSNASISKNICKNGALFSLYYYDKEQVLFAGGFDGVIVGFSNAKLEEKYRIDIQKIIQSPCSVAIRSLDANAQGELLVGTKGGEIVEISLKSKTLIRSIMKSHFDNELWAVTVNPVNSNEVASGGGDRTLRIWDLKTFKQKKFMMLPEDFRAIDWSSDGKFVIIGTMVGLIYYVNVATMTHSAPFKSIFYTEPTAKKVDDKDKWIQELKISPNNQYAAFGSHCGYGGSFGRVQVLLLTNNEKTPLKAYASIDAKITSALTHLDWSSDSTKIVLNSLAYELKHINIESKALLKSSDCVWEPDLWHTWTCLFGYPVQGIWPPASTGYIVNYTCLSNNKKVLATSDDFSLVKLFRGPCTVEKAAYKAYGGHSSHIPKIRFTPNDKYIVSVGGNDKSVFIWETDFGQDNQEEEEDVEEDQEVEDAEEQEEEQEEPEPVPVKKNQKKPVKVNTKSPSENNNAKTKGKAKRQIIEEEEDVEEEEIEAEEEEIIEEETKPNKKAKAASLNLHSEDATPTNKSPESKRSSILKSPAKTPIKGQVPAKVKKSQAYFEVQEEDVGDNAGNDQNETDLQWKSTLELPDNIDQIVPDDKEPNISLTLDYVFGYRTKDNRNNLRYINETSIVYHAGNLGIILNTQTNKQTFFTGHKNEIGCFAMDNTKTFIATGEGSNQSEKSQVIVWQTSNLQEISKVSLNVNGINTIAFSPSGKKLVCCCLDEKHTIYVVNVESNEILASVEGGPCKIIGIAFRSETEFGTVGIKHYKFWTLKESALTCKDGAFLEKVDTNIGLIVANEDKFITGSGFGQIIIWKEETITFGKKIHSSNIDSFFIDANYIISGGRDMVIVIMEKNLNELYRLKFDENKFDSVNPIPRSIDFISSEESNKLLIGTLGSEIIELTFSTKTFNDDYTAKVLMNGHYSPNSKINNEIVSLIYSSTSACICSLGEDYTIRFWDPKNNCQENCLNFIDEADERNKETKDFSPSKPTSMALNQDESNMAVGFSNGSIRIYENGYVIGQNLTVRKYPIYQVKYSPDNQFLATATQDETQTNIIDIFSTKDYSMVSTLKGHTGIITRLDWSVDSTCLSSTSQDGELRFFNVTKGTQIKTYSDLKNEEWSTWTRNFGWPLKGYYDASDSSLINACERAETEINFEKLIGIGDEKGQVKLYKYPIMSPSQKSLTGDIIHCNRVSNLKISTKDNCLFTSGGDSCIFKWKIISH